MCEYKMNTGSNSNLMHVNMFKILFSKTAIGELDNYKKLQ